MKSRPLATVGSLALLCACGSTPADETKRSGGATAPAPAAQAAAPAQPGAGVLDPDLPKENALAVEMLKDKLPLRQNGATITAIEANGPELVHTIEVPQDLDEASFAFFQLRLPAAECGDPQSRRMLERGGIKTYRIRDKGGQEFMTTISSCEPPAPPPVEEK